MRSTGRPPHGAPDRRDHVGPALAAGTSSAADGRVHGLRSRAPAVTRPKSAVDDATSANTLPSDQWSVPAATVASTPPTASRTVPAAIGQPMLRAPWPAKYSVMPT